MESQENCGGNQEIIISPNKVIIPSQDWNKQSLRKCLLALGISNEEMRYSKIPLAVTWAGNIDELVNIIKKTWKREVVKVHEATGNNPQQWKMLNVVYAAIMKKLAHHIRKTKSRKNITFTCHICGRSITKKYKSAFQNKSFLCNNRECKKEYHRRRSRKERERKKINLRVKCKNPECYKEFITSDSRKKFCSPKCRTIIWKSKNIKKLKLQSKLRYKIRPKWKERFALLTPEKQEQCRKKRAIARHRRLEQKSPEQLEELRAKLRAQHKSYYKKRKDEGRPIINKYIPRKKWLEQKRLQYINKPWIYETILQKFLTPNEISSH